MRLKTSKGDVVLELFEDQAPNTVANFISLVEAKRYDGTAFHRVIPNFYAESERVTSDILVERLLEAVPTPRSGM